jgi:hypothetical protein
MSRTDGMHQCACGRGPVAVAFEGGICRQCADELAAGLEASR